MLVNINPTVRSDRVGGMLNLLKIMSDINPKIIIPDIRPKKLYGDIAEIINLPGFYKKVGAAPHTAPISVILWAKD
ncbi:MAG: hypothetical protein ABIL16_00605 [candidate division WOR-3 bacterium]